MPKERYESIATNSSSSNNSSDTSNITNDEFDFSNITNKYVSEIIKLIPGSAARRILIPNSNISAGFEYTWMTSTHKWRVRFHGPDSSAPVGSNALSGWIVRIQRGSHYIDSNGVFHPPGIFNLNSPHYSENLCNDTHIPVLNDLE